MKDLSFDDSKTADGLDVYHVPYGHMVALRATNLLPGSDTDQCWRVKTERKVCFPAHVYLACRLFIVVNEEK